MSCLSRLRDSIEQHRTAFIEREIITACSHPDAFSGTHSVRTAFNGLFAAGLIAIMFWSGVALCILRLHH
jgi:hypothetical protein